MDESVFFDLKNFVNQIQAENSSSFRGQRDMTSKQTKKKLRENLTPMFFNCAFLKGFLLL